MIDLASLPSKQFTAGAIAKANGCTLAAARAALDDLVSKGHLVVKVAKSGARNYSLTKGAKNAKTAGTLAKPKAAKKIETVAAKTRGQRLTDATAERRAVKEWEKSGRVGARPLTPNLDSIENGDKPAGSTSETKTPRGTTVQFLHDGKPLPSSQNKMSSVAWYFTKNIDGDKPRISVAALRDLFAKAGITDPSHVPGWSVELPNGITISTTAL